jgi:ABC-type nitrate/sulfonate/bicarbonate transport system permease component
LGLIGIAGLFVLWEVLARFVAGSAGTIQRLATPVAVVRKLWPYVVGRLGADLWASLQEFVGGWVLGAAIATIVGLLLGRIRIFGKMFLPVIEALRPVSMVVWVPLSVVWFGFGYASKLFVVALAVFLVVIVYAVDGCTRIPGDVQRTARMLGMSPLRRYRSVIFPATLSEVLIGARVALMVGWGTVIVAELVAADSGLGAHLLNEQQGYNIASVMATMACFAVIGYFINALFGLLERMLVPWRE